MRGEGVGAAMTDITVTTNEVPAASLPVDAVKAPDVLMVRGPGAKGHGVTKAMVPAAEVENYAKAGWHRA